MGMVAMKVIILKLLLLPGIAAAVDLAASSARGARRLHSSPNIHLSQGLLSKDIVSHMLGKMPKGESAWMPCIGQRVEYFSKRCAFLPVKDDDVILHQALSHIEAAFNVDTAKLRSGPGLPLIRYLPGAPAVGIHGDIGATGLVPNATLVVYLTDADAADSGSTFFPKLDTLAPVVPKAGSVLSFQNVDAASGLPDPRAHHGVSRVSSSAAQDRIVVQIPLRHPSLGANAHSRPRGEAYAEHVSGGKHTLHLGIMGLFLLGWLAHYVYQNYLDPNRVPGVGGGAFIASIVKQSAAAPLPVDQRI